MGTCTVTGRFRPDGGFAQACPPEPVFPASDPDGKAVPPRQWVVRDLVPSGTVTLLGGDGGTGKSLVALQLAYAVATGRQWLGRAAAGGGALFISAEDDVDELHRRIADVASHEGESLASLHRLTLRSLAGEDALLATLEGRTGALEPSALFAELDARVSEVRSLGVVVDRPGAAGEHRPASRPSGLSESAGAFSGGWLSRSRRVRHDCAPGMVRHVAGHDHHGPSSRLIASA